MRDFVGTLSVALLVMLMFVVFGQGQQNAQEQQGAVVAMSTVDPYGDILVDANGKVLYLFSTDTAEGSSCTDECAQAWPPLLTEGEPSADKGVNAELLGTIEREDGSSQVTYNGHPLYYFVRDENPGEANGQGIEGFGGEWYVVSVGGDAVEQEQPAEQQGGQNQQNGQAQDQQQGQPEAAGHAAGGPAQQPASFQGEYAPVNDERLQNPEPENWLMYKRTYDLQGYSPLDQINVDNIGNLVPVWTFSTGVTDGHEAPAIVNDGIMFVTGAFNTLFALDARSGDLIWEYRRDLAEDVSPEVCCGMVNRGVALYDDKVYMATLDAHLLAFDAISGEIVWDTTVEDYLAGYAMTVAPLAVDGKIIVGVAGGEYGIRGFIAAYDAQSGDRLWKTYTIPAPGEPGSETWEGDTWQTGGAPIWVTGSYDPETNLTYWGTGNGGPWMGEARPGDNLYVSSVVALDVDTGEIKAHYQYVPNDSWDYDEISDQTLVDVERDGETVKGLIHAGRNGYFYLLDRTNLDFIYGVPYIEGGPLTITGFEDDGRPIIPEERKPGIGKAAEACPVTGGANNWFGLSFSPQTGYAYVPTTEYCMTIQGTETEYRVGQTFTGANADRYPPQGQDWAGALQAIDVATGEVAWKVRQQMPSRSPVMATAGGLVFGGDIYDREFRAYDAETGDIVWRFKANSSVLGVPSSYEIDGVQYIAVAAGYGGAAANYVPRAADAFGVPFTPVRGGTVWVFALKQ